MPNLVDTFLPYASMTQGKIWEDKELWNHLGNVPS